MNRLTFLKRLFGGVAAAPVVAKALAGESKTDIPTQRGTSYDWEVPSRSDFDKYHAKLLNEAEYQMLMNGEAFIAVKKFK